MERRNVNNQHYELGITHIFNDDSYAQLSIGYTDWFSGDTDMAGNYGGYDGPCPPWNDSIVHHYYFTVYALDVRKLGLSGAFTGPEAVSTLENHVLAKAVHMGTYSMNRDIIAEV
ncbi:MAG: hypothetical protein HRU28_03600 [Rhizobiales bacterium]|nr:hypothetical protein [Hyphomicrobiales bacterium]